MFKVNSNSNHCLFSDLPSASTRVRQTRAAAAAHPLVFEVSKCRTSKFARCFLIDIFINQTNWPLDKLINQQEGMLAYKVINGTYLLNDFLNHGDVGHQIRLRNGGDLRIPLYAATQSQLFVRYRAIKTWNGLSGDLRSSTSLCTFKNKLRQLYLSLS